MRMTALLTSSGFLNPSLLNWANQEIARRGLISATIITTAARLKEKNEWAQVARQQFIDMGVSSVSFFDFEQQDLSILAAETLICVNGGNTFRLMHAMAAQNTRHYLDGFFNRNGLYIGTSAGAAVMGARIDHLSDIGMDPDDHGWGTKPALAYINSSILPHAGSEWSVQMAKLEHKNVIELQDGQGAVLNTQSGQFEQFIK